MAQAARQMGLATLRRTGGRTFEQVRARQRQRSRNAGTPSLRRTHRVGNLPQLHRQLWSAVPDISGRWFLVSKGARTLRNQFQLPALSTLQGEAMKKFNLIIAALAFLAVSAKAEIRSLEMTVFGMD